MTIGGCVKAALSYSGKKQADLADRFGVSRQSFNNKFSGNHWYASDLITIANELGCKLMFVFPDGQQIQILENTNPDDE